MAEQRSRWEHVGQYGNVVKHILCTYLFGNYDLFWWFSLSFSSLQVFHELHFIQTGLLWWFYKKVWILDYSAKTVMIKRLYSNHYGKLGLIYILRWSEKCLIRKASYHKLTHTLFDIIYRVILKFFLWLIWRLSHIIPLDSLLD